MKYTLLAAVTVVLLASDLQADPPASPLTYTPPAAPTAPDPTGLLLRLFGLTALMMVLCGGSVWLARRMNRPKAAAEANGRIRHQGTLPLDRRGAVHLFEVDGQTVAVTTDASGLRSIVVLSESFEATLAGAANEPPTE